jgi:altronate dehydratase
VQKGGHATVTDVLAYGGRLRRPGLTLLEAPGNDAVSTTAMAAAGATLTLFSTGRGKVQRQRMAVHSRFAQQALCHHFRDQRHHIGAPRAISSQIRSSDG